MHFLQDVSISREFYWPTHVLQHILGSKNYDLCRPKNDL
jgi:hypothetical protein